MVDAANDPPKQYYTILDKFRNGKIDTSEAKMLSRSLMSIDEKLASDIAEYYLSRIPMAEIGSADNLQLLITSRRSAAVEAIAVNYLKRLQSQQFIQINNLGLFNAIKKNDDVLKLAEKYLQELPIDGLDKQGNKAMASLFKKSGEIKRIVDRYINSLSDEKLLTIKNIQFLRDFTTTSQDRGFVIFYSKQQIVDSIMNTRDQGANVYVSPKYSQLVVDDIIFKEEIKPYFTHPLETGDVQGIPWKKIKQTIKNKYSKNLEERIVLTTKASLYKNLAQKYNKYWNEYIDYSLEFVTKYGTDTTNGYVDATVLNNLCWDGIFMHSHKKRHLLQGIRIMEGVIGRNPNDEAEIDTYASLLYKAGRAKEAIFWENRALELAARKKSDFYIKLFRNNIIDMKSGKEIWLMSSSN
jgi:hypothetical protein